MNNGAMKEDLIRNLLILRSDMERAYNANKDRGKDKYSQGICVITKSLMRTFDRMFNQDVLRSTRAIHPMIEKYCYPWPGCPICNAEMEKKNSKFGEFWGCSKYPDCSGNRKMKDKYPTINEALKIYLTQKAYEETMENNTPRSRFRNLEI